MSGGVKGAMDTMPPSAVPLSDRPPVDLSSPAAVAAECDRLWPYAAQPYRAALSAAANEIRHQSGRMKKLNMVIELAAEVVDAWPKMTLRTLGSMALRIDALRNAVLEAMLYSPERDASLYTPKKDG